MMPRQYGFTLLEVMIALVVVAIGLGALIQTGSLFGRNTAHLRERTLAHWVAMNHAAELRLRTTGNDSVSTSGDEFMGSHEWHWQTRVETTPDASVLKVEIRVYRDASEDTPANHLITYLPKSNP